MSHRLRLTAEKVAQRLRLIAPKLALARAPIDRFRLEVLPDAVVRPDLGLFACDAAGPLLEWDSYWGGQDVHFVLRSRLIVPKGWKNPALHLPLGVAGDIFTHPEALLHIDGQAVASADRYHHTIEVPERFVDGLPHDLLLHGWTGLTGWPPDPADRAQLFLKECSVVDIDRDLQDFCVLAGVALDLALALDDDRTEKHGVLSALDAAFLALDTRDPMDADFRRSIRPALARLEAGLVRAGGPLDIRLHAAGHAHMDVAYLWPVAQIRQKNARTYSNVLRLMERHDAFTFSHSQPQLYQWTEEDHPEIFAALRDRVADGRWEILGGMWVEPDANMPGPEALVRQIALARAYCDATFGPGAETPVLWLPDTFGFPACLPQLMVQAGLKWFVTNKVNWNQYNQMPASTTWWEGLDGSRVLAQFLTTPRMVQHLPFPTNYKSDLTAGEVLGTWTRNTVKDRVQDLLICYGYGDGGGGPTDDLIRKAQAWGRMPGVPKLACGTVRDFFETLEAGAQDLPVWQGEFYLEGHRGVLTSQGWIKRANRKAEVLLHDTELAMALAMAAGHAPHDLTAVWQRLCMTQFHDILTGTSVTEVFEDARRDFAYITAEAEAALAAAVAALMPEEPGWLVLDGAQLPGVRLVELPGESGPVAEGETILPAQAVAGGLLVELPEGGALSTRMLTRAVAVEELAAGWAAGAEADLVAGAGAGAAKSADGRAGAGAEASAAMNIEAGGAERVQAGAAPGGELGTEAGAAPGAEVGMIASARTGAGAGAEPVCAWVAEATTILQNAHVRVEIGAQGLLTRIFDRRASREVLRPGATGNRLELFEDRPVSWDAWDIDIFFEDRGELVGGLVRIYIVESGPLRATVEIERAFRQSRIVHRISLTRASARIDFHTHVDWHETHLLLKVGFPVDIRASRATFDIQWGQIDRPTHRNTSWDAAQFEVPAQKWADLSEGDYGVALLNDCKYGYDVRGDVLRLSLIKSATMPDRVADQGAHEFTYALLPHLGDTRVAVRAEAYALNYPPRVVRGKGGGSGGGSGGGPGGGATGPLARCLGRQAVIETVKPAEDGDGVIVRLYEAHNTRGPVRIALDDRVAGVDRVGLLEEGGTALEIRDGHVTLTMAPCEIVTLRLRLAGAAGADI